MLEPQSSVLTNFTTVAKRKTIIEQSYAYRKDFFLRREEHRGGLIIYMRNMTINETLNRLSQSRFRASFHLSEADVRYIDEKGMETIRSHCRDFVRERLSPEDPVNDGKQTPWKGHPVFPAQHACACCCRGCLNKWYRVPKHTPLSEMQQEKIVNLLMTWIEREYKDKKNPQD